MDAAIREKVDRIRQELVDARKRRGVSQEWVAKMIDVSRQRFSLMEQPGADFTVSTMVRWAEALDMDTIMLDRRRSPNEQ